MPNKKTKYINRDISWLAFNDRVLQEAEDPRVPLLERMKFLGIFSSNMDEFFRIRVATLRRLADLGENAGKILGGKPKKILAKIQSTVLKQRHKFDNIYTDLLEELAQHKIFIVNEKELTKAQGKYVRNYFRETVRPTLVPVMVDTAPAFPELRDKIIYLLVGLSHSTKRIKKKYALIELPTDAVPRFLVLPKDGDNSYIILLDDVIRFCLDEIFHIFSFDTYEAYTIKLTRDAELALDDDISESYVQKLSKSLKQRKRGRPIRFIYDDEMPQEMLRMLLRKLGLRRGDNVIPGARYHNFKDFIKFPKIGTANLRYADVAPIPHRHIGHNQSIFMAMRKRDILLHYPYQSFHYVIDFLREASIDPLVSSIKITLYRISQTSNVANALINAVKNGKQVTVLLELQARFDEENNIYWANRLREEGAKVIFGVPSVKVHAKICLITRKERGAIVRYAYIGTGNFNEDTSRLYSDHGLFTRNKLISQELNQVFTFLENNFKTSVYKNLLVSPYHMRSAFYELIDKEIAFAKEGKKAYMILKMNSLVDPEMIQRLYDASQAGVRIQLIVRGICSLKPGVKGVSENIKAISIIDKYLEHSRIFVFGNGGAEKIFFGSADWMSRNLDHRIEVDCPIYDKTIQKELKSFLQIQLADNTKARILDKNQNNAYKEAAENASVRAQLDFYEHLKVISQATENDSPEPETETRPVEKVVKKTISTAKIIIR